MDERLKTNLDCWNEMAAVHLNSPGYRVDAFRKDQIHLYALEREEVGDVRANRCFISNVTSGWTQLQIARKQSARSFELRATMSLARLLRDPSRRDEAGAMLAEIYNWFTEGFDTADLKDAKALLDQLTV